MEFVALDLETANADISSICQIGLAHFRGSAIVGTWKSYVDPEDYFDPVNISIHGITEDTVRGAPTLPAVASELHQHLSAKITVCHTHFDRTALQQAFSKYALPMPTCTWLDTARVARRAWQEFARQGYGLASVCDHLGYTFAHHDALEDAKAAGFILLSAIDKTGLDLTGWLDRVRRPISPTVAAAATRIAQDGNPEGPLHGEVVVFTGALTMPRRQAADLAAQLGCEVAAGVTKRTTVLVVGDQDARKLAGHGRSSKHRKAEILIMQGQSLRILRETDFQWLVKMADTTA